MKTLKTTITYKVPDHEYCNHTMQKSTPHTRCRFCTDIGKNTFVCVLHNQPLAVVSGVLVQKCEECKNAKMRLL